MLKIYKSKEMIILLLIVPIFLCILPIKEAKGEESMLPEASVYVDGQPINTNYIMKDGHFMVPSIFIKHTGAKVNWNEEYQSVVFQLGNTYFAIPLGEKYTDTYIPEQNSWQREELSTITFQYDANIYVPLLDVVNKLGMDVSYNQATNRTFIETKTTIQSVRINTGSPANKYVSLTFDDGPENHYTPQILDILNEKGVPATFFVVGQQVVRFPSIMKRIVNEGHGLGNHTWSHPAIPTITTNEVIREIKKTQKGIDAVVGREPDIFRPPFGAITRSDDLVLQELGLRTIMWSVDTLDWTGISADEILSIVQRDVSPGGIILQHNIEVQPGLGLLDGSVEALPKIIDRLKEEGYTFVTIQTLLDNQY
ncbi:polysaccharide deacetylase family protein [Evansella sp. AB-P1]|uniref:polysaccharide deacetylase family protein n=1 Tax=Evansella sp. AB-P1 TaxID=3037653 RepID=UPI00241ED6DF|nr:polysaccharide deacetylase family protein [Evansella sp. AB-P1]MDG5789581.1 polysaccharide deacetylase family protein [Evansella sp. AB-P1]